MVDTTVIIEYSGNSDCKGQVTIFSFFLGWGGERESKPKALTKQNCYSNLAKNFIKYYLSLWDVRIIISRSTDEFLKTFQAELFKEKLPS